jgi:hypothetical protein
MQICVSSSQPQNAPVSISRRREPASKVTHSNRQQRSGSENGQQNKAVSKVKSVKQFRARNSTDAGIQIDFNAIQKVNVPLSSRRSCEFGSNVRTSIGPRFAKKPFAKKAINGGITCVCVLEPVSERLPRLELELRLAMESPG